MLKRRLSRRTFVGQSLPLTVAASATLQLAGSRQVRAQEKPRWKAAIIGATGRGNFGHDHDVIFRDRPDVAVVAVADADEAGRAKAAARAQAARQYADYREMLEKEKPDLVCVAPRWTDQHHAMGMAALRAGAHLYFEKPFTQSLDEADELLALAEKNGRQIVVAHQMPLAPSMQFLKKALADGIIGQLLHIRAHGKQDSRAGGEDMIVLGTHLFHLIRFLAGDVVSCAAEIRHQGHRATLADTRAATEKIGPVIGDAIEAQFTLASGASATFISRADYRATAGPWGLELHGSKGVIRVLTEIFSRSYLLRPGTWTAEGRADRWEPLPDDPSVRVPQNERGFAQANHRVVADWLEAIEHKREPVCSGRAGMKALEMAMAVFAAGLSGQRITLPMMQREHPLIRVTRLK